MPDSITPVGAMVQPPSPMQGLSSLSSILGVQQQAQNLQRGAYGVQQAQAGAVQAQQQARETQAAAQLLSDPIGNGILEADGKTPTQNAQSIIMRTMPTTGAARFDDIVNAAHHKVDFDNAKNNLNLAERQAYNSAVAGYSAGAKTPEEVEDGMKEFMLSVKGSPVEDAYQALNNTFMEGLKHVKTKSAPPDQIEPWRQFGMQYGRAVLGAPATAGAGGIGLPGTATTGAGTVNRAPLTGALSNPPGAPTGSAINPTPPQVAGATTRQVATGNADVDRANDVGALQQPSSAAIELTKRIDQLSHEIGSGHLAKMISETGNYLGFSDVNAARSELNKDLGQVKGLAIARAGSDSRAATILEGYPTDTTPENTVHVAMDYIRGTARQNLARGQLLSQYQQKDPQGLRGFQAADNIVSGQTNPLMHEYLALKPAERTAFYRRNFATPQEAQTFKDQIGALQTHTRIFGP